MFAFLLDVIYVLILVLASPWLVLKAMRTGKYRAGLAAKFFGAVPARDSDRPCVWFHAVSVGEVLLLKRVVAELARRRPDVEVVISTTTNTGMEVARKNYGEHADGTESVPVTLIYFPLDFSWAVSRAIARVRPDVVALAELELWPNFIAAARRSGARVVVVNGRMSPRSRRGYGRIRFLMRRLLAKIDAFAVQTDEYATRFIEIGAPPDRIVVSGSVKYDGVETDCGNPATTRLRELFSIHSDELVWVAGSTSEPEESIALDVYEQLRASHPSLRLIVVPRHKERFDEVAEIIRRRGHGLLRRSQCLHVTRPSEVADFTSQISDLTSRISDRTSQSSDLKSHISDLKSQIILIDTLGELSAVWGLAHIAFVGGSFAPRGGQNMIEPAGYGAAVVFGPGVWNFQDTVNHLLACGGAVQVATPEELTRAVRELACDASRREHLGAAARAFVESQHGATARTVELVDRLLPPASPAVRAAA